MRIPVIAVLAGLAGAAQSAHAFCGFYVSGSGGKLFNDATQVVLMRDGTRTVLAMQNDYKGPLEDFAMVVPVPTVLHDGGVTGYGSIGRGRASVKIEAKFDVAEYQIVILSATDSAGLTTWLEDNKYKIPAGAAP